MLRIALIYGAISGAITIAVMTLGYALATSENATGSQVIGYWLFNYDHRVDDDLYRRKKLP
jgi:hypothetical protein